MKHKGIVIAALIAFVVPILACNVGGLTAWGDLVETAKVIWAAVWTEPEPDYEIISVFCTESLKAVYGDPPEPYIDDVILTTQQIAIAWGIALPYSTTFTIGTSFPKLDGSGRIVAPLQFANPGDAYGVPLGGPVTGLCLEFEETDFDGTPVPLLADGYQVGDWVLPTTTPQIGYADCASGITPTPTPTPTPIATDTPTPAPGDAYEDDDPPNHSAVAVNESQSRTLEPHGDEDVVHLWVWSGLHLQVRTHSLGGYASTNVDVITCSGTFSDTDGGEAIVQWTSVCDEVVIIRVRSSNGYYGPGETYTLEVNQL